VIEVRETTVFSDWLASLRDAQVRVRVQARILRLRHGNPGDLKPVGEGVSELRIDYSPGYRVYYVQRGPLLVILLAGGAKPTQDKDIKAALKLARMLQE
jgi:putative addiction module killer protein